MSFQERKAWFAVQVRPRSEIGVAAALRSKGSEPFVPTYVSGTEGGRKSKPSRLPLFPGYLFCQVDPNSSCRIVTTPDVIRILGYGRIPAAVDESEIATLKALVESGVPAAPWRGLRLGDAVRITSGPLCGVEGVLCEINKCRQLVVSVTILQRSALVEMKPEWVTSAVRRRFPGGGSG